MEQRISDGVKTVYYKGDPRQQSLTLIGPAGEPHSGWRLVEWPKGQGRGKENAPWIMWHAQLSKTPWTGHKARGLPL